MLTALRGALAFLTRLPVGGGERAWDAFRTTPAALPLAGHAVGLAVALPLALPVPVPAAAAAYVATCYLVTGVTHADGLADCGDAAAVHGSPADRRAVLDDPAVGVGGALSLGVVLAALVLGALGLAGAGARVAVALAVAAEVGAKTGMALLAWRGPPAGDGLGAAVVGPAGDASVLPVALAALPVFALAPSTGPAAVLAAVLAGPAVAVAVGAWARAGLGGISGDVLGATNEIGRVAGVHAGVVAWTLF